MSNSFGNTIAVGNINDLAGILATLTPDQLQNVQLDPALHEALMKSIETTTVLPAGYQQQHTVETQILPNHTNDSTNVLLNQPQVVNTQLLSGQTEQTNVLLNQSQVVNTQLLSGQTEQTNVLLNQPQIVNNQLLSGQTEHTNVLLNQPQTFPLSTLTQPLLNVSNPDVGVVVTDGGHLISTNIISPQKTDFNITTNNMIIQPQPAADGTTPMLTYSNGYTVVPNQQTVVVQNLPQIQTDVSGIQGIQPGEASSLILTPTVMSQVQPTATIQTINITDSSIINSTNLAPTDSVIISQPVQNQESYQTINLQEPINNNTQPSANLTFQIPISSTSQLLPSTVTLDPNLLKKQAISLDSSSIIGQNIQLQPTVAPAVGATTSNQCVIVDGNIISTNDLLALTTNNLPVLGTQQVLIPDIIASQQVFVNNFPQNYVQVTAAQPLKATPSAVVNKATAKVTSAKKPKMVQTISNFTPDSPIFKSIKETSSASTTSNKNVIVTKKTISVKKSESQRFSMKPTNVQQVQPGIFKFQLKKVESKDSDITTSVELSSAKSVSLSSLITGSAGSQRTVTNLQKIGRNAQQLSQTTTKPSIQTTVGKTSHAPAVCTITIKTSNLPKDVLSKLKDFTRTGLVKTNKPVSQTTSTSSTYVQTTLNSTPIIKKATVASKGNSSVKTSTPLIKIINGGGRASAHALSAIKSSQSSDVINSIVTPPKSIVFPTSHSSALVKNAKPVLNTAISKVVQLSKLQTASMNISKIIPPQNSSKIKPSPSDSESILPPSKQTKNVIVPLNSASKAVPINTNDLSEEAVLDTNQVNTKTSKSSNSKPIAVELQTTTEDSLSQPQASVVTSLVNMTSKPSAVSPKPCAANSDSNDSKTCHKSRNESIGTELEIPLDDNELISRDLECNERGFVSPAESLLDTSPTGKATEKRSNSVVDKAKLTLETEKKSNGVVGKAKPTQEREKKLDGVVGKAKLTLEKEKKSDGVMCKAESLVEKSKVTTSTKTTSSKNILSPEEISEMETFREVIESTRAGSQEDNMRELAKQEIEKQLKRFNTLSKKVKVSDQKETVKKNPSDKKVPVVKPANKHGELKRKGSNTTISETVTRKINTTSIETSGKKSIRTNMMKEDEEQLGIEVVDVCTSRDNNTRKSDNDSNKREMSTIRDNVTHKSDNDSSKSEISAEHSSLKKDKVTADTSIRANDEVASQSRKSDKKRKKQSLIVEENRKRGRPKKFDDFILVPDSKKEKKTKKFFFPKEEEKENDSDKIMETSDIDDTKNETKHEQDTDKKSTLKQTSKPKEDKVKTKTDTKKLKSSSKKSTDKKLNSTKKKSKTRKDNKIAFEPEVLPEHLKTKAKTKVEDTVIDITKVKLKSSFTETSFVLDDIVELKTYRLLNRSSWLCTLCGKPGNLGSLDVLFGPYKIKVKEKKEDGEMNVWLHRDCAIWTSNICLSNQTLCGLGESLDEAAVTKCCLCSQVGATLLCGFKQCRDGYHFVCAKQRGCSFQMENFTIKCPKH